MKIGIDLDGTAWKYPDLFSAIVVGLQSKGHQVGIITCHINLPDKDLNLWIKRGFPPFDFYISKVHGEENIPAKEWKLQKAKENSLDFIIDNFDTEEIFIVKL